MGLFKKKSPILSLTPGDKKYQNRIKNLPESPSGHTHAKTWEELLDRVVKIKGGGHRYFYRDGTVSNGPMPDGETTQDAREY